MFTSTDERIQEYKVIAVLYGIKISPVCSFILSQSTLVTKGQTDRQTEYDPEDRASIAALHGKNCTKYAEPLHCVYDLEVMVIVVVLAVVAALMSERIAVVLQDEIVKKDEDRVKEKSKERLSKTKLPVKS